MKKALPCAPATIARSRSCAASASKPTVRPSLAFYNTCAGGRSAGLGAATPGARKGPGSQLAARPCGETEAPWRACLQAGALSIPDAGQRSADDKSELDVFLDRFPRQQLIEFLGLRLRDLHLAECSGGGGHLQPAGECCLVALGKPL
jgi:hypothetical protein